MAKKTTKDKTQEVVANCNQFEKVVANCDRLKTLKFSTTEPFVFTEFGVSMLPSVLNSQKAVDISIRIIDAFVAMRRFLFQNAAFLMRIAHLEKHQIETDEKIDLILDKIEEHSPKLLPQQFFAIGCIWDAWTYISDLVRSARQRIVLIDNFVDDRVLSMLTKRAVGVKATIHSRYNEQFLTDLKKHNSQYPEIAFIQLPHRNHDRFLIVEGKVYQLVSTRTGGFSWEEMRVSPRTLKPTPNPPTKSTWEASLPLTPSSSTPKQAALGF